MLPLDLHVLGLSLAFILSQDQTLLCKFFIYKSFVILSSIYQSKLTVVFFPYIYNMYTCTTLLMLLFQFL